MRCIWNDLGMSNNGHRSLATSSRILFGLVKCHAESEVGQECDDVVGKEKYLSRLPLISPWPGIPRASSAGFPSSRVRLNPRRDGEDSDVSRRLLSGVLTISRERPCLHCATLPVYLSHQPYRDDHSPVSPRDVERFLPTNGLLCSSHLGRDTYMPGWPC